MTPTQREAALRLADWIATAFGRRIDCDAIAALLRELAAEPDAAAAERERAAKVCDDLESSIWRAYKAPSDRSQHTEGRSDGAAECAAAIRAMPAQPPDAATSTQAPDR